MLLRRLAFAAWAVSAGLGAQPLKYLDIQIWQLSCSQADPDGVLKALSLSAEIFKPCGIQIRGRGVETLEAEEAWCHLPAVRLQRRPLLREISRPRRLKLLRGLSLFVIPTPSKARYAFSLVDESPGAGCGSPEEAPGLAETGAMFITDFGTEQDLSFTAQLLAHEISHELTMKRHPTHAPRGSVLADHTADYGPLIPKDDCACMRQSPFLAP